jgi:hypothetical protein
VRRLLLLAVAEMPGEQTYLSYCVFFIKNKGNTS